jgi:hypothetical protein
MLLPELSPDQRRRAGAEIVKFRHRLEETGLFTDPALARLIDETPREMLTVCTMREDPPADETWIAGEAGDLSGAELVAAARTGQLWISPRSAMTRHPLYARVFARLMDEFSAETGIRVLSADAAVLVSSPRMGIFFHVDPAETMLMHVRGHKTLHVYPPTAETVTEQALEAILLKETLSDLPYSPALEAQAAHVALEPGEALYWPLHAPHRVTNSDDLNVSVSVEFSSPRSRLENGVFYTNGVLRRRLGLAPRSRGTAKLLQPAYLAAATLLKTVLPAGTVERDHARRFDVDLASPGCVRWREGQRPDWATPARTRVSRKAA